MKIQTQLLQQIKKNSLLMLMVWFIYLFVTSLIIGIGIFAYNIPVWDFTKEPNRILGGDFYIGALSNLGVIIWTVAATLCIFFAIYLKRYNPSSPFRLFLLHAGILTTLLLLDDVYMLHDGAFPVYLNIDGYYVYGFYFVYILYLLIRFRKVIFETEYLILLSSILLLSLSVLADVMEDRGSLRSILLNLANNREAVLNQFFVYFEDTFKGLGIITWVVYFSRVVFINILPPAKNTGTETSRRKSVATPTLS